MAEDKIKEEICEEAEASCQSTDEPETVTEDADNESAEAGAEDEAVETGDEAEGETAETAEEEPKEEPKEEQKEEPDDSKYLRLLAEFQNFKKRTAKEKTDIHAYANEKIVVDLLPVLDNFERALATNAGDDPEAYAKGMSMILEQLKTALTKVGVKELEALGADFDPTKHNAVMQADSEEYEEGKVCNVLQKGYELNGKVVRAAMVAVAK